MPPRRPRRRWRRWRARCARWTLGGRGGAPFRARGGARRDRPRQGARDDRGHGGDPRGHRDRRAVIRSSAGPRGGDRRDRRRDRRRRRRDEPARAQRGDHRGAVGRSGPRLLVVADEIKDLADRVLASTKEIGGLIRSVQDESEQRDRGDRARQRAVRERRRPVGRGRHGARGDHRGGAATAARGSRDRPALREQAKAAGHVVELMERVRGGVDEIRAGGRRAEPRQRGGVPAARSRCARWRTRCAAPPRSRRAARCGSARAWRACARPWSGSTRALQEQSQACSARGRSSSSRCTSARATHEEATRTVDRRRARAADTGRGIA